MTEINLNLTGQQVLDICNALNGQANQELADLAAHAGRPEQHRQIVKKSAAKLHGISRQLIGFIEAAKRGDINPHIPCVIA